MKSMSIDNNNHTPCSHVIMWDVPSLDPLSAWPGPTPSQHYPLSCWAKLGKHNIHTYIHTYIHTNAQTCKKRDMLITHIFHHPSWLYSAGHGVYSGGHSEVIERLILFPNRIFCINPSSFNITLLKSLWFEWGQENDREREWAYKGMLVLFYRFNFCLLNFLFLFSFFSRSL